MVLYLIPFSMIAGAALFVALPETVVRRFALQTPKTYRLVLKGAPFNSPDLVPIFAEHRVEQSIPAGLTGIPIPTKISGRQIQVDSDVDGRFDRRLTKAQVIEVGNKSARHRVLLYPKQSQWYASSGRSFQGQIGKTSIQFLDTNLDGSLTAGTDLVRIGSGAFGLHQRGRLLWTGTQVISYEVDEDAEELAIEWRTRPEARLEDALLQKSFNLLNHYRNLAGLQAVLPDAKTAEACAKHVAYLNRHLKVRHWVRVSGEDLDSAHSEDPTKEGYSKEGAEAARSGSIGQTGNPVDDFSPGLWSTALHRQTMVSRLSARAGMAYGGNYSLIWIRDWSPFTPLKPVFVPAPGQKNTLTTAVIEIPEPEDHAGFYDKARGFPISVTFLKGWKNPVIRLFVGRRGKKVKGYYFSPKQPIHTGRPRNMGALLFIPDKPLQRKTWYRATLTGIFNRQPRSFHWSFRTGS